VLKGLQPPYTQEINLKQSLGRSMPLEPGESVKVELEGPASVQLLNVRLDHAADETEAWRGLVLIGTFDGAGRPQIWCPAGDFFGSSPGANLYAALPFTVAKVEAGKVAMWTRWPMPFEKTAVFELRNLGKGRVEVDLHAITTRYPWTDRSMHFHAKWRTETMQTRPFRDWTYCELRGQGVFVGDALNIFNPSSAWWGEGDEKV